MVFNVKKEPGEDSGRRGVDMVLPAIISLIIGVILLVCPLQATVIMIKVIGVLLIVSGVVSAISFLMNRSVFPRLLLGILMVILGIIFIAAPGGVMWLVSLLFGIMMLAHGIRDIGMIIELKNSGAAGTAGVSHVPTMMIMAILTIVFGLIMIFGGFFAWSLSLRIIAIWLLFDGISDLILALNMRRADKARGKGIIDVDYKEVK